MSDLLEQIRAILESRGEHYNEKHALIRQPLVFSISTLSRGVGKQVWYKNHNNEFNFSYESPAGQAFVKGRAIHEFIQKRFTKSSYWKSEVEVVYDNGYFVLLGHIDLLNISFHQLVEIKTTKFPIERLRDDIEAFKLQAGTYAEILKRNFDIWCHPHIFVLNETITEFTMNEDECRKAFDTIERRGYMCLEEMENYKSKMSLQDRINRIGGKK